jgi:hypothetical protein
MHAHNDLWRILIAQHALPIQNHEYQAQTFKKNILFPFSLVIYQAWIVKKLCDEYLILGPLQTNPQIIFKKLNLFLRKNFHFLSKMAEMPGKSQKLYQLLHGVQKLAFLSTGALFTHHNAPCCLGSQVRDFVRTFY